MAAPNPKKKGFTPDWAGIASILTGPAAGAAIRDIAESVAAAASYPEPESDGPVQLVVELYVAKGGRLKCERTAAAVVAKHAAALPMEAKYGTLLRALRAASGGKVVKRGGAK